MLAQNHQEDLEKVYRAWLSYGLLNSLEAESSQRAPVPVQPADMNRFRDVMKASWPIMEKTVFVRGHVICDNDMFPDSVARAFDIMTVLHSRDDWEPGASKRVEPTDENIKAIIAEKEEAEQEVDRLAGILKLEQAQLPAAVKSSLKTTLELYQLYVRGFKYCAIACFRARKAQRTSNAGEIEAARKAAGDLLAFRRELAGRLQNTSITHHAYWLLDVNRLDGLASDVRQQMAKLRPA
jgi:soluble cytochrome b562